MENIYNLKMQKTPNEEETISTGGIFKTQGSVFADKFLADYERQEKTVIDREDVPMQDEYDTDEYIERKTNIYEI